ncbi:hypothetical protein SAMN04489762_3437 [Terribacillus saccharophilus]|uniref:Antitoxin VbhA domain-containing protein n=1 Tax=Terribacillus saccharophilus TaxID=361277 RepID=A0AAX2EJR9_9BACI|nr:hypothetical protein SAMN04489762_3437 [Terribacillus saccharophilus]
MPKRSIEESIRRAKASNALEGLHSTKEQDELVKLSLEGKITHDDFIKKVLELTNE